jgi:hypothetical protein
MANDSLDNLAVLDERNETKPPAAARACERVEPARLRATRPRSAQRGGGSASARSRQSSAWIVKPSDGGKLRRINSAHSQFEPDRAAPAGADGGGSSVRPVGAIGRAESARASTTVSTVAVGTATPGRGSLDRHAASAPSTP